MWARSHYLHLQEIYSRNQAIQIKRNYKNFENLQKKGVGY